MGHFCGKGPRKQMRRAPRTQDGRWTGVYGGVGRRKQWQGHWQGTEVLKSQPRKMIDE